MKPRVAVVGGGSAGLASAWFLGGDCELTLYERESRLGGHVHALAAAGAGAVETGFLAFHRSHYPTLVELLEAFKVETAPSPTGLAIWDEAAGLAFRHSDWPTVFGERLPVSTRKQLADLMARMFRHARRPEAGLIPNVTLAEFLTQSGYDDALARYVLFPSISALWGFQPADVLKMSAVTVVESLNRFFVTAADEPFERIAPTTDAWLNKLGAALDARVVTEASVTRVQAHATGVEVETASGHERFDYVILATHADTALALLAAPTPEQAALLAAFPYCKSVSLVHTDARVLGPVRSDYNYRALAEIAGGPQLPEGPQKLREPLPTTLASWDMQRIQGLAREVYVTVAPVGFDSAQVIAPEQVLARIAYAHPAGTPASVAARPALERLNAQGPVFFCGSYFGTTGSNECALASARAAAKRVRAVAGGP